MTLKLYVLQTGLSCSRGGLEAVSVMGDMINTCENLYDGILYNPQQPRDLIVKGLCKGLHCYQLSSQHKVWDPESSSNNTITEVICAIDVVTEQF